MKGSILRASLADITPVTSKSFTDPPKRVGKAVASKCVIGVMPLLPARIFSQDSRTLSPTGDTTPKPVTTTRRLAKAVLPSYRHAQSKRPPPHARWFRGLD